MTVIITWQKLTGQSDRAIVLLLSVLKGVLILISTVLQYDTLKQLAGSLPATLNTVWRRLGIDRDDYNRFAVCEKCHTLYDYQQVVDGTIRKCSHKPWPNHPQINKRRKCNASLLVGGRSQIPKRVYCFRPCISYLKEFVKQNDFLENCNKWRNRQMRPNVMADVYDGNLWKREINGYLENTRNLYGLLNFDFFQPFKHSPYSLGAIYMVILNLPRTQRFKEENVMLLGVIPGPTEPKKNINSYLLPIVDDLQQLEQGVRMLDGNTYRLRLFGCSSDLPATRKLGGFLSFHAKYGK